MRHGTKSKRGQPPSRLTGPAKPPFDGPDPKVTRALAEAFPAPVPDIVRVRKIRKLCGGPSNPRHSIGIVLPQECLIASGMKQGDHVLISAWTEGVIRVVRVAEADRE